MLEVSASVLETLRGARHREKKPLTFIAFIKPGQKAAKSKEAGGIQASAIDCPTSTNLNIMLRKTFI